MALSTRGSRAVAPPLPYFLAQSKVMGDLYDAALNPSGAIPMCVAESRGRFHPSLAARMAAAAADCVEPATGQYANMLGRDRFRAAAAASLGRTVLRSRVALDASQLVVSSGCGGALLQLSLLLLDAGDVVLLPTPTYPALYNDFQTLGGARVVDVPIAQDNYRLTAAALDAAHARAGPEARVRVLVLLNPSNPLGIVHSAAEMRLARDWARGRGMHLIVGALAREGVRGRACVCEGDE